MEKAIIKIVDDRDEKNIRYMVEHKSIIVVTKIKKYATRYTDERKFNEAYNKAIKVFGKRNHVLKEIERS